MKRYELSGYCVRSLTGNNKDSKIVGVVSDHFNPLPSHKTLPEPISSPLNSQPGQTLAPMSGSLVLPSKLPSISLPESQYKNLTCPELPHILPNTVHESLNEIYNDDSLQIYDPVSNWKVSELEPVLV